MAGETHFERYHNEEDDKWRWRLRAGNGEKIASGQGYENKSDCTHAIHLVMDTVRNTPIEDVNE